MTDAFLEELAERLGIQIPSRDSIHYEGWSMLVEWGFYQMIAEAPERVWETLNRAARIAEHDRG